MNLPWLAGLLGSPLLLHLAIMQRSRALLLLYAALVVLLFLLRGRMPALVVGVTAFFSLVFGALSWYDSTSGANVALFSQTLAYGGGAWLFGRTLRQGRTPLVEHFANVYHRGAFPDRLRRYTRGVTIMWALLMAVLAVVSLVLGRYGSQQAWSWFTNVISWVLILLAFIVEYRYRVWHIPDFEHAGPIKIARDMMQRGPEYFAPQR